MLLWHWTVLICLFWGLVKLIIFSNVYLSLPYSCCEVSVQVFYPFSCLTGLSAFFLLFSEVIYIFKTRVPCQIHISQILPSTLTCTFILGIASSDEQKFLLLMQSNLSIFFFILRALCMLLNKYHPTPHHKIIFCLIFKKAFLFYLPSGEYFSSFLWLPYLDR